MDFETLETAMNLWERMPTWLGKRATIEDISLKVIVDSECAKIIDMESMQ